MLEAALAHARPTAPDAVLTIGGGAVLDLGKALAALLPATDAPPIEFLEVVGSGRALPAPPLPLIALPTTAGTGSEATKNAVISVPSHRRKVSLRDDRMVPALTIIDPALTDRTPPAQTLASGFDAVTQVIEPYLSARASPFTDALARPAIAMGLSALRTLMETGEDPDARDALAYVAHVSGIALANAGLGAVHGLAGVLGGETGAPHGLICARLLPPVLTALAASPDAPAETRTRLAQIDADIAAAIPGGTPALAAWMARHGLPSLPPLDPATRDQVAEAAHAASSMKASPVTFSTPALAAMLDAATAEP